MAVYIEVGWNTDVTRGVGGRCTFWQMKRRRNKEMFLVCFHFSLVSFPSSFAQLPIGSEVGKTDIGCVYRVHIVTRKIVGAPG